MKIRNWQEATIQEIVNQLESCDYQCEVGKLIMNVAFLELKRRCEKDNDQREALEFYSDFNNYSKSTAANGYDVLLDNGEIARKALKD